MEAGSLHTRREDKKQQFFAEPDLINNISIFFYNTMKQIVETMHNKISSQISFAYLKVLKNTTISSEKKE